MSFSDDPLLGRATEHKTREVRMGDIVRAGATPMQLHVEVIGTAPIDRLDVLHGTGVVKTARPYSAGDLGRRVRVLWEGAEYRGRGRETIWQGKLGLTGNRFTRFAEVNFLNPERKVQETAANSELTWTSVTTGNLAGIDLWLDDANCGTLELDTNVVSGSVDLAALDHNVMTFDGGMLGRKLSVYLLPESDWARHMTLNSTATHTGKADLPVYVRVTQADGNQAWSSPIYLIG